MNESGIEAQSWARRRVAPWLLPAYPFAFFALSKLSTMYWFLPAGLRLATLWLLPKRWWPLMLVGEATAIVVLAQMRGIFSNPLVLGAVAVLPWCLYAVVVASIARHGRDAPPRDVLPDLLACGAAAALVNGAALATVELFNRGTPLDDLPVRLISFGLGDLAGIVMVLPLLLSLLGQFAPGAVPWRAWIAHGLVAAPMLIALALHGLPEVRSPLYPLVIALLPVFAISYRYGWRQGALALSLLAVAMHLSAREIAELWHPGQLQLMIGVTGVSVVLLGVASERQQVQQRELSALVDALSTRGVLLVEAANRIATLQEDERRRIGAELHDQIGQDMTAIATRLRVVERTANDPAMRSGLTVIRELVSAAHNHLREVIDHLHPAVLDRFGLARALAEGPFAQMLRDADIEYICEIEGNAEALPDTIATAIYRIGQEAATNCARHGCGGLFHLRLVVRPVDEDGDAEAFEFTITDGAGRLEVDPDRLGMGLLNIRDRANAIGAEYEFNPGDTGPRHTLRRRLRNSASPGAPARGDDRRRASRSRNTPSPDA